MQAERSAAVGRRARERQESSRMGPAASGSPAWSGAYRKSDQQQPMPQQAPSAQQPAATICVTWAGAAAKAAVDDIAIPSAASLSIFNMRHLSRKPDL